MEAAKVLSFPNQATGINPELIAEWIASTETGERTKQAYLGAVNQLLKAFTLTGITAPERADLMAWRADLMERLSPASVSLYITAVKLFFTWTAQSGIYRNIATGIKGAKLEKNHKKDYLTASQARDILLAASGSRDRAILTLMLTTGLRCIEVSRANIDDIRATGGAIVLYVQGKGRTEKAEYVKLSNHAYKSILAYLSSQDRSAGALFTSASNNSAGLRLTTRAISGIVKNTMKRAGYNSDRLTAHSLRHTAATLNLLAGGTLQETQQLLRHRNINTTTIYAQNLERMANQSESRIDIAIFGDES
ncbi:MAG: tyrosine-type recombinase/integrase [Candidatus Subteraquimicrobiales bacterium]|nr:tyrosine-type recombinase/integrase [Candidatus Subteraquimicrobiales bacterium]